jgi:putative radical SAM enzyme (TIGR03279 family)
MAARGIKILEVSAGSAAERIGLRPGDRILTANGHEVPDELALRFSLSEELVDLWVTRLKGGRKHFTIDLSDGTDAGIKVEEFRTRTCNNSCLFCFVDQLPPGVRPALRVKDDDYRLSFLHGNYITLTNIAERELSRILEQRLSPLYVSVHATDPELRRKILGRKRPDDLMGKLRKLVRGGIRIHAQIVLIPGMNDGKRLKKTVYDLFRLYPGVQSVAIVPVGISEHGKPKDRLTPVAPFHSRSLIREAGRWCEQFRAKTGRTFVYLADEFYLQANVEIPESGYYDEFAQIEDGVGMVRNFLDTFRIELGRRQKRSLALQGTLATGPQFFPILQQCIERLNHKYACRLKVCAIANRFLGRNITVAGLLAGRDILAALKKTDLGDFLIVPGEAVSQREGLLLDDVSLEHLSGCFGIPVYSGGHAVGDFFQLLFKLGEGLDL